MSKLTLILMYYIIINLISFIIFFIDKQKSKKDRWRIQEKTLHTLSYIGGVFGSIASMLLFHHKTKKPDFVIITIIALMLNLFVLYKLKEMLF
ncbi:DUF1294 domain-containing protein [Sedimentibacter sp.]|uniref:DUF1294 domain-containing protein n=1 Tax=Sedimentibacter sp. TaxID=1960295 RepID=UPI0028A26AC5|nr:DUF1294 domain-containing protein [Sedimentibacter sp.]